MQEIIQEVVNEAGCTCADEEDKRQEWHDTDPPSFHDPPQRTVSFVAKDVTAT